LTVGPFAAAALAAAILAWSPAASREAPPALSIEGPFGTGAGQVWLVRPSAPPRSVVVFGHGWKVSPPSPLDSWVRQFAPWLAHLVARGNAVVFPRYQLGTGDSYAAARVASYRASLELGFARLNAGSAPVVVAGYSYGASLGFYYAANAGRWKLPLPAAVDAVFPAGMIPGAALPQLSRRVRVLIEVGDRDTEAGAGGGLEYWRWLQAHAWKRFVTVRSHGGFVATHAAPKLATPTAQRAFWLPLDGLIEAARSS
jgi:pimeloyl-ACP methyl ester carboxylesterase